MDPKNESSDNDILNFTTSNSMTSLLASDKIDVEDLIKDFKIFEIDNFTAYLTCLWKVDYYLNYNL